MFALFPNLLDFYPFASLVLRVVAGYLLLMHGWRLYRHLRTSWTGSTTGRVVHTLVAFAQSVVGILFLIGVYVQGAALAGAIITFIGFEVASKRDTTTSEREVLLLLCAISLALVVLGAGPFAFDLPV
jgi:uncharacterized membrane protein YphA (DoxX/SURF4 family)